MFVRLVALGAARFGLPARTLGISGIAPEETVGTIMSFYVRKTIKTGPVRLTLSGSGITVSAGVPGLRVGVGPCGSYVRVGAGGVTYRSTSGGRRTTKVMHSTVPGPPPGPSGWSPGDVVLSDVTGSSAMELLPAQPSDVVAQLNSAAKTPLLWPWVAIAVVVLSAVVTPWLFLPGAAIVTWVWWHGKVSRTVALFYEVDGPTSDKYQLLVDAFSVAQQTQRAWHRVASGAVRTTYQRKVNAGASSLVDRTPLTCGTHPGPHISTNIVVPTFRSQRRTVYLLPDRMLVKDGSVYADVDYRMLQVSWQEERFIETEPVPSDSLIVGHTWRYVNKSGGPDRRFKDNTQLPIVKYGQLNMESPAGLNLVWTFSRVDTAQCLTRALQAIRR
ncbi:MAG TPA: DUF4236 domain-containing protein [Pseudonocardiaceae bacterium]|nr:DUF4236 domain-containing protein [Pseudonocardiaceae bacterium]